MGKFVTFMSTAAVINKHSQDITSKSETTTRDHIMIFMTCTSCDFMNKVRSWLNSTSYLKFLIQQIS